MQSTDEGKASQLRGYYRAKDLESKLLKNHELMSRKNVNWVKIDDVGSYIEEVIFLVPRYWVCLVFSRCLSLETWTYQLHDQKNFPYMRYQFRGLQ